MILAQFVVGTQDVARSSLMWRNGSDACGVGVVSARGDKRIFRIS
jgi:hypothetical protein